MNRRSWLGRLTAGFAALFVAPKVLKPSRSSLWARDYRHMYFNYEIGPDREAQLFATGWKRIPGPAPYVQVTRRYEVSL